MYIVCANLYCGELNDYVYHWDGGEFTSLEEATEFYNIYRPDEKEIERQIIEAQKDFPKSEFELEIGLWDSEGRDVEFYNEGLI